MGDGSSSSSMVVASLTKSPSNARSTMKREVYKAAEKGTVDVLQWLNNWKQEKTAVGNNVLHVHIGRPLEIRRGVLTENVSLSFIQYVIDETFENFALLQSNDKGDTPLHLAARFGHTGAVQEFLTRSELVNAGLVSMANNSKDTALHDATRAGHAGIVMLLVEVDGENALHHMPNNLGETPLFLAAERGCIESFTTIVGQTGLTALEHRGPCGHTALHLAVLCGNKVLVDRILEIDTSSLLIRIKNDQGQTPLHCCAAQNVKKQRMILRALLHEDDEYNSAAHIQDNEGRTPLHLATLNFNFIGAKMLIRSYPDCVEMVDHKGQNVVHFAARSGCLNTLELFLRKAPECDKLINEKDNNGNTPLHLLVANEPIFPIHGCFSKLPVFLKRRKNLDVRAVNVNNLTAGDIIVAPPKRISKILPKGRRILPGVNRAQGAERAKTNGNVEKNKGSAGIYNCVNNRALDGERIKIIRKIGEERNDNPEIIKERINHLRKVGDTRLIVATLIVTMSFTAGFTLPGGYDQGPGKTTGLAVLANNASFVIFLVSDMLAFTVSSIAVICYFKAANQHNLPLLELLSAQGYFLISVSMGALMIAFVTGVCTVVSQSSGLALILIGISLVYITYYVPVLIRSCFIMGRAVFIWNFK